jgi:di/tricarboxylate transporter
LSAADVTRACGNHLIYLFPGGFLVAVTMDKCNLQHRIALHIIRIVRQTPQWIVPGFMPATALQGVDTVLVMVAVVLPVIFLTEVTSSTATASLLLPVMGALAAAIDVSPFGLMIATVVAASSAFMLPVAKAAECDRLQ